MDDGEESRIKNFFKISQGRIESGFEKMLIPVNM